MPAEERNSGTTATVLMVWEKKLVVAHCGDSRAVMAGRNNSAIDLTARAAPCLRCTSVMRDLGCFCRRGVCGP